MKKCIVFLIALVMISIFSISLADDELIGTWYGQFILLNGIKSSLPDMDMELIVSFNENGTGHLYIRQQENDVIETDFVYQVEGGRIFIGNIYEFKWDGKDMSLEADGGILSFGKEKPKPMNLPDTKLAMDESEFYGDWLFTHAYARGVNFTAEESNVFQRFVISRGQVDVYDDPNDHNSFYTRITSFSDGVLTIKDIQSQCDLYICQNGEIMYSAPYNDGQSVYNINMFLTRIGEVEESSSATSLSSTDNYNLVGTEDSQYEDVFGKWYLQKIEYVYDESEVVTEVGHPWMIVYNPDGTTFERIGNNPDAEVNIYYYEMDGDTINDGRRIPVVWSGNTLSLEDVFEDHIERCTFTKDLPEPFSMPQKIKAESVNDFIGDWRFAYIYTPSSNIRTFFSSQMWFVNFIISKEKLTRYIDVGSDESSSYDITLSNDGELAVGEWSYNLLLFNNGTIGYKKNNANTGEEEYYIFQKSSDVIGKQSEVNSLLQVHYFDNIEPLVTEKEGYVVSHNNSGKITKNDPHYGWLLGSFYVSGFSSKDIASNGDPVFIKQLNDEVKLSFRLNHNINALNGDTSLTISDDVNGYDQELNTSPPQDFGRGTLIVRKTDYQGRRGSPQIYTNYLPAWNAGADTEVKIFEEGDYEIVFDYEIKKKGNILFVKNDSISNYRMSFRFQVRNGNSMVHMRELADGEVAGSTLSSNSVSDKGFMIDTANSHYLKIIVERDEIRMVNGLPKRNPLWNGTASNGSIFRDEGLYTIIVSNNYNTNTTKKVIYVGSDADVTEYVKSGQAARDIQ